MPTNRTPTINSEVAIGCRMNEPEKPSFMAHGALGGGLLGLYCQRGGARRRRLGRLHHGADLEPILPGDHDPLAGRQALLDDRLAVAALADLDGLDADLVVVADDEGKEPVRSALDRVIGNDDASFRVSTSRRVDTERPGHSTLSLFSNVAFMRMVPLAWSTSLLTRASRPSDSVLQAVRAQRLHRDGCPPRAPC